jgi:hypothetical protein
MGVLRKMLRGGTFLELVYAEAALCALPETKPTDLVVALRKLTPVEIVAIGVGPSPDCFVDQWKKAFIGPTLIHRYSLKKAAN